MIAPQVRLVARRLDRNFPWWSKRIVLRKLDMMDCTRCILGQMFGLPEDQYSQIRAVVIKVLGLTQWQSDGVFAGYYSSWAEAVRERRKRRGLKK